MCQGGSQYGSSMGQRPQMMNTQGFQQTNFNPTLNPTLDNAMNYGSQRAGLMPGFRGLGSPGGQYGAAQSGAWPFFNGQPVPNIDPNPLKPIGNLRGPDGRPMQTLSSPASVFGKGAGAPVFQNAMETGGGMPRDVAISSPASAFGIGSPPVFQNANPMPMETGGGMPKEYGQEIASPASVFQTRPMQQVEQSPQIQQQPNNAFANSMLYANPMQLSQAQLGPSFNPAGSAQGGYFQGNNYIPNKGNARNGLDDMNRWGFNWNGQALNPGPFIR